MVVELVAGDAGLDAAIHVGGVDLEDGSHARHVDADAAAQGGDVTFERGTGAERDDGDVVGVAQGEQAGGFLAGLDEGDGVGLHAGVAVLAMGVLVAEGGVGRDPVAEELAGLADDGVDGAGHGVPSGAPGGRLRCFGGMGRGGCGARRREAAAACGRWRAGGGVRGGGGRGV